jgi:hypothetical protein
MIRFKQYLTELSKGTLKSYIIKSAEDLGYNAQGYGKNRTKRDQGYGEKYLKKGMQRQAGITKAAKKLAETTKDEVN